MLKKVNAFTDNMTGRTLEIIKLACKKRGIDFSKVECINTTDGMKGSTAWTLSTGLYFWHDDSSKNIKNTCSLGTQFIMNAPLNQRAEDHIMSTLDTRKAMVNVAANSGILRGEYIGRFGNDCVIERDLDSRNGRDHSNTIVKDMSKILMETNLNPAFGYNVDRVTKNSADKCILHRQRIAIGGLMNGRSIGQIRVPGSRLFVIYNQNLAKDECMIGKAWAKKFKIKIGDELTDVKSPVGPLSARNRKVVGFLDDTYDTKNKNFDVWFEISNHYGHDFDGDKKDVMARTYMRFNLEIIDGHEVLDEEGNVVEVKNFRAMYNEIATWVDEHIDTYSTPLTPSKDYYECINQSYRVLYASTGVGMTEDLRRQFSLTLGQKRAWVMSQVIFDKVSEGILIKGKKHNVPVIFDYKGFVKALVEAYGLHRANAHKLVTSRKISEKAIANYVADPELDSIKHEAKHIYDRAFDVATAINDLYTIKPEDIKRWREFRVRLDARYKGVLNELLNGDNGRDANPELYADLIENYLDTKINFKGIAYKWYTIRRVFYTRNLSLADFAFMTNQTIADAQADPRYAEMYYAGGFTKKLDKNPQAGVVKAIYHDIERAWSDSLTPYRRLAMLVGTLHWGAYSWLYNFEVADIKKIVDAIDTQMFPGPKGGSKIEQKHTDASKSQATETVKPELGVNPVVKTEKDPIFDIVDGQRVWAAIQVGDVVNQSTGRKLKGKDDKKVEIIEFCEPAEEYQAELHYKGKGYIIDLRDALTNQALIDLERTDI
jgi:ribosomal protein S13